MAKDKKKLGKILLYLFYGGVTVAVIILAVRLITGGDVEKTFEILKTANIYYVLLAVLVVLLYMAIYPLTLNVFTKTKKIDVSFKDVYIIGMTEHFFNGITPFATGGQPFQIYALTKKKVKASVSTGMLVMNFLVFLLVTNTFAVLSMIYYPTFAKTSNTMAIISIIGFTINFSVLLFTISMGTSKTVRRFFVWSLKTIGKIKFLSNFINRKIPEFETYLEQTQTAFKELWGHKGVFFSCYGIKAVAMLVYYAIPFAILKALNVDVGFDQLFFIICGTAFAITMVVFLPTPGSSGGIEFAFASIFSVLGGGMDGATSSAGMILWRTITFYIPVFISFVFYIVFEIRNKTLNKRQALIQPLSENIQTDSDKTEDKN